MYLSRIWLDPWKRGTAKAIYNPEIMHGALERSFPGGRQHALWRMDGGHERPYILAVSHDMPDFTRFHGQFGHASRLPEVKDYTAFLEKGFQNGDTLRFRLAANPAVCTGGSRVPLTMERTAAQPYCATDWVRDRLEANGAEVLGMEVLEFTRKTAVNKEHKVRFTQAVVEGVLRVSDRDKLAGALEKGIGHEKAYGCGLLTVMRA